MYFRDIFKFATLGEFAESADKLTRNEIFTKNEIRQAAGRKPSKDPKADQLINSNINHPEQTPKPSGDATKQIPDEGGENQNGA